MLCPLCPVRLVCLRACLPWCGMPGVVCLPAKGVVTIVSVVIVIVGICTIVIIRTRTYVGTLTIVIVGICTIHLRSRFRPIPPLRRTYVQAERPRQARHMCSLAESGRVERCAYCGWSRGTHQAGCPNEEPPWRATGSCKPCSYCARSDGTHSPICEHWSSPAWQGYNVAGKTSHTPPTLAGLQRRLDEQTLFNRKVDNCIEQMLMLQQRLKDQTQRQDDLLAKLQLDVVNLQSSPCIPVHKRGVTATGTVSLGRACQQMCELPRKAFERISVVSRLSARRS